MPGVDLAGLALIAALATGPAMAQSDAPRCGPRAAAAETLATRYGEAVRFVGIINAAAVVEVWASDASGTWTLLVTNAEGETCVIFTGGSATFGAAPKEPAGRGG